ncbi:MAG: Nodulin-related protein CC_0717 [uncultured Friedmanniella sp.]|uniref:Nodulin-related protein CC_0717 n=1 Tax=uncultured Friedmanniella sp. TaxID=335381 RepID=A0A6J4JV76_9ACTN|nr:VIT1/CCC1 transporter family protein [uncultured Friedmanniella sp.]CAA9288516.1 MAG: Nodulin-related protein CC_0717 [uncultured Friedmanniella sp.]
MPLLPPTPTAATGAAGHVGEPHATGLANRLNGLRAAVLGANDGIVSVAAIAVGVAGATPALGPVLTAGAAGLVGGAVSMALGEYVSVSSQRDSERALIAKERAELESMPEAELDELTAIYRARGLSAETARRVAVELTEQDALGAHLDAELNIDPHDLVSPWRAASASAAAFVVGALLPLLAVVLLPQDARITGTAVAVLVALAGTGAAGAWLGHSPLLRPTLRVVVGGALALTATFAIGRLLGTTVLG